MIVGWPHAHLPQAIAERLAAGPTAAGQRVYTEIPRQRTYPLIIVQDAGLGPLGTDAEIQADERRVQVDAWAERRREAQALAAQIFRLLDGRFEGGLRQIRLLVLDETEPTTTYEMKVERCARSGGGDAWFDEFARVYRATAFYTIKINL